MNTIIQDVEKPYIRTDLPEFAVGDTVRVHTKIREGDKERIQIFEGDVIRWKRGGARASITVRKISHGVGVERVFPLATPTIDKIEVKSRGRVRRARLYYLRDLAGKAARIKQREE
ncbi:50S ribosomal protein L19 [Myxococcota bacterium]|nr:50S ribosomal protein L19 [Myxococcota bacterium]